MKLPQYITIEEVQRVCRELGFRDWTKLSTAEVLTEEARLLQAEVGGEAQQIPLDEFHKGLEKAVAAGDLEKLKAKYQQLLAARLRLSQGEVDRQGA